MSRSKSCLHCVAGGTLLVLSSVSLLGQGSSPVVHRDETKPAMERVKDLLSRMTLEEKVAQLESGMNKPAILGSYPENTVESGHVNEAVAKKILSLGLGTYAFLDEFVGASGDALAGAENRNALQAWVLKNTRLGIPILFYGEALHGAVVKGATSFPEPKQATTVTFEVSPKQLSILNAQMRRVVEPGSVDIQVGSSSTETKTVRVIIAGDSR